MSKPQGLLDELHEIDFSELFIADPPRGHKTKVKLAKKKLREVKRRLRAEQKRIKLLYDGRNKTEAILERRYLACHEPIDSLIAQLGIALSELEVNGPINPAPSFGTMVVGDLEDEEWHVYTEEQAKLWQRDREFKSLLKQGKENSDKIEKKMRECKQTASTLQETIKSKRERLREFTARKVFLKTLTFSSAAIFGGIITVFFVASLRSPGTDSLCFVGLLSLGGLYYAYLAVTHPFKARAQRKSLMQEIDDGRQLGQRLKGEFGKGKLQYRENKSLVEDTRTQYQEFLEANSGQF